MNEKDPRLISQQILMRLQLIEYRLKNIQLALKQHGVEVKYTGDDPGLPGLSGDTVNDLIQTKK